jgi:hypothetical protein
MLENREHKTAWAKGMERDMGSSADFKQSCTYRRAQYSLLLFSSWVHERLPEHEFVNDNMCFGRLVDDNKHQDEAYKSLDFGVSARVQRTLIFRFFRAS